MVLCMGEDWRGSRSEWDRGQVVGGSVLWWRVFVWGREGLSVEGERKRLSGLVCGFMCGNGTSMLETRRCKSHIYQFLPLDLPIKFHNFVACLARGIIPLHATDARRT